MLCTLCVTSCFAHNNRNMRRNSRDGPNTVASTDSSGAAPDRDGV